MIQHCLTCKISFHGIKLQQFDGSFLPLDKSPLELNLKGPLKLIAIEESKLSESKQPHLVLKVRYKYGPTLKFKMLKKDPLAVLFDSFCKQQKLDPHQILFSFDGTSLLPSSTPLELEMEDGDLIDAK